VAFTSLPPAAILGPGNRFTSDAQLAAYAGAAPLEASSAGHELHRLNRGGNRRSTMFLTSSSSHRLITWRQPRPTWTGKSPRASLDERHTVLSKRFIVRASWRPWQECQQIRKHQFAKSPPRSLEHRNVASCCLKIPPKCVQCYLPPRHSSTHAALSERCYGLLCLRSLWGSLTSGPSAYPTPRKSTMRRPSARPASIFSLSRVIHACRNFTWF
jgi:hypothetical protein